MITKIEIDGKEQFAILLHSSENLEDILCYSNALLSMIRTVSTTDIVEDNIIYHTARLADHLTPTIDQMLNLQGAHFGTTRKVTPTTPEPCKIWR